MQRFALRNYAGRPVLYYLVERKDFNKSSSTKTVKPVSDLILVLDCSGSMYGDLPEVRATVLKILTLDEYRDANLRVTVITYSSKGDVVTHFERVPVAEIMQTGSNAQKQIRELRTRGMTCISQGLMQAKTVAEKAAKDGGTVCVCLLSDGYANDVSPTHEQREIAKLTEEFKPFSNVYVNTIAFNPWSDFKLLAGISNALSGACIQANTIKRVYDTIYDTSKLLAGRTEPAATIEIGNHDYQVFVSRAARKVLGAKDDLVVRGLAPDHDKVVYQYRKVTEAEYNASTAPDADAGALYAFARAQISEGAINKSKYAMVATRNQTLLGTHAKALTGEQIAAMASDLDRSIYDGVPPTDKISDDYGLPERAMSVLDLCNLLDANASTIEINVPAMLRSYKRRGLKMLQGKRDDSGKLVLPRFKTAYTDHGSSHAACGGFDINRTTATINMMVRRPISLVDRDSGAVVHEVAGVKLDKLTDYKQYTVVGDGTLNLDEIQVRITSKQTFRTLEKAGAVTGPYVPTNDYTIRFADRPLVSYETTFAPKALQGLPERLYRLHIASSLFGALLKETSVAYTPDQVASLKDHGLSPNLYVNFPSTVPYTDKDEAVAKGEIDARLSYKVNLGTAEIPSKDWFDSANKFLGRFYVVTKGAKDPKKPVMMDWWAPDFTVEKKDTSKLKSITKADLMMVEFFDDFFCLKATGAIEDLAGVLGIDSFRDIPGVIARKVTGDDAVEALTAFKKKIDKKLEETYRTEVSPLAFYVGATGLLPDDFGEVKALTADQFVEAHPGVSLGKDEKEATFFEVGTTVLSVYAKAEFFSTATGLAAAAVQQDPDQIAA